MSFADHEIERLEKYRRLLLLGGVGSGVTGSAIAVWVGYKWFVGNVSHEVWALFAATLIIFAVQLIFFWTLSELLAAIHQSITGF